MYSFLPFSSEFLFTRFPNPITYDYLHSCVDAGTDLIVTVHSHCLGGMETYKGVPIFHSLGDFVMDGSSYRRRESCILNITIDDNKKITWNMIPVKINKELTTVLAEGKTKKRMIKSYDFVINQINKNKSNYTSFFKRQYNREILYHSLSTLKFLLKSKGFLGLIKILIKRIDEVKRTILWSVRDRSKEQRDDDAIKPDRKRFSQEELF